MDIEPIVKVLKLMAIVMVVLTVLGACLMLLLISTAWSYM